MTRAVLVGIGGTVVLLMLLILSVSVELHRTAFGEFVRDSAGEMQKPSVSNDYVYKYGDPIDYLAKWVRLNQMLVDPALCTIVGVLIGLSTRRTSIFRQPLKDSCWRSF